MDENEEIYRYKIIDLESSHVIKEEEPDIIEETIKKMQNPTEMFLTMTYIIQTFSFIDRIACPMCHR
jgi:hypothetical protein